MRYAFLLILPLALAALSIADSQNLVVNVNLTLLNVFVEDENGLPVLDLTADDFLITENGQTRPVKHLLLQTHSVAVGLLLDRSSSIAPVKENLDQAVIHILEASRPGDPVFLMTFAGTNELKVPWTTTHQAVLNVLRKPKLGFGSRVYEALAESIGYLASSQLERKVLILVSDGADHYSTFTIEQVTDMAMLNGINVYMVGYFGNDSRTSSKNGRREVQGQFEHLARMTGGDAIFAADGTDCSKAARQFLTRVQYDYQIGFYSSEPLTDSRDVHVKLREGRSGRVMVRNSKPVS